VRLEFQIIIPNIVFNGIFSREVFQIEVSDGRVRTLGTCQKVNCSLRGCLRGHKCLGVCMCLEFQTIISKSVFNGILIGKVFQIEVSDGLVHSLGTCQKVNLHTARVFINLWGHEFSGFL